MPVINQEPIPGDPVIVDPPEGPCDWPVNTTCVANWSSYAPVVQASAIAWATYVLWSLTGRRYGACEVTVRPCGPRCQGPGGYLTFPVNSGGGPGVGMPWMIPWIDSGVWRNCGCAGGCTCAATCEVVLPGPVASVEEVSVDGLVLANTAYRVDIVKGQAVLVRTDGGCWPECQNMDAAVTEAGSFAVTYKIGSAVPVAGMVAAGELAGEFAKACAGQDCSLPQQLASLTRNGVEVTVMDPSTLTDLGLTGIANVDLWIRAVNPGRKAQRSRVYSPDLIGPRFTT